MNNWDLHEQLAAGCGSDGFGSGSNFLTLVFDDGAFENHIRRSAQQSHAHSVDGIRSDDLGRRQYVSPNVSINQ